MRRRETARPNATPRANETLKESKKMPIPWNIEDRKISVPWNCDSVLHGISPMKSYQGTRNYSLVHNDTNGVIQQTLPKNNIIQLRINFVLLKDRQNSDRIRS